MGRHVEAEADDHDVQRRGAHPALQLSRGESLIDIVVVSRSWTISICCSSVAITVRYTPPSVSALLTSPPDHKTEPHTSLSPLLHFSPAVCSSLVLDKCVLCVQAFLGMGRHIEAGRDNHDS